VAPYAEQEAHVLAPVFETEYEWVEERLWEAPSGDASVEQSDRTDAESDRCNR
jgi:hypothetical protein